LSANPAVLAHQFDSLEQQREAATLGLWMFLATEVLFFGGLFTGYAVYRSTYPAAFAAGSERLNLLLGTINTILLITSSLTMALAVHAAQAGRRRALLTFLVLTMLLGTAFLGIKAVEWYQDYEEHLVPRLSWDAAPWREQGINPREGELFFTLYFILTGLHGLHMVIGVGVLSVLLALAYRGAFTAGNYTGVELAGLYWHFVDIVWIFLLPLLYLIGTHGAG
jgi:cytochrome c oxidase subunit III